LAHLYLEGNANKRMIFRQLCDKKRQNPKVVKSAHSYRRFPSDFFEENKIQYSGENLSGVDKAFKYADMFTINNNKEINSSKNMLTGEMRPIQNFKYHLSKAKHNHAQRSGSCTERKVDKVRLKPSLEPKSSFQIDHSESFSDKMYGMRDLSYRRSHTNHRSRNPDNGKFLEIF
jgi:hypothetical protein